eukprot:Nitzschia sp. Nitz4//scaffold5_size260463//81557//83321//NITZ4_000966-RA/size260463-processed-gene-0.374-mRNA-1//-1//CDS//3329555292//9382//frame0
MRKATTHTTLLCCDNVTMRLIWVCLGLSLSLLEAKNCPGSFVEDRRYLESFRKLKLTLNQEAEHRALREQAPSTIFDHSTDSTVSIRGSTKSNDDIHVTRSTDDDEDDEEEEEDDEDDDDDKEDWKKEDDKYSRPIDDPNGDHQDDDIVEYGTISPAPSTAPPTASPTLERQNVISVPMSVAIYQIEQLTEERAQTLIEFVTGIMATMLDVHSPFDVITSSRHAFQASLDFQRLLKKKEKKPSRNHKSNGWKDTMCPSWAPSSAPSLTPSSAPSLSPTSSPTSAPTSLEDNGDLLARLYLTSIHVWESPFGGSWLQFRPEFSVYWPNGNPILSSSYIQQIENVCVGYINGTVEDGHYWLDLLEADPEAMLVASPTRYEGQDEAAIAAIERFQGEYALSFDDYGATVDQPTSSPEAPDSSIEYEFADPLTLMWGVREWSGLGLGVVTLCFAFLLSALSSQVYKRQETQHIWGLTEQGVGELLAVGWTYHKQEGTGGQLYLKVFDKGRLGYNDDNSVLDGGIIKPSEESVTHTSPETATMDSPHTQAPAPSDAPSDEHRSYLT